MRTHALAVLLAAALLPLETEAQSGWSEWLNAAVDTAAIGRFEQRGSGRQAEAPSVATGSTTILDRASFSDLIGVALSLLPPLGDDGGASDLGTRAVSLNPYAVSSALVGGDPQNPIHFERNTMWRVFSVTLGTEEADEAAGTSEAVLLGVKVRVWSQQTVDATSSRVRALLGELGRSTAAFERLNSELLDSLYHWTVDPAGSPNSAFINGLEDPATLRDTFEQLGPERASVLLGIIASHVDPFLKLRAAADSVVEELRSAPQLALDVQSKLRDGPGDEVNVGLILDLGLTSRLTLTLNSALTHVDTPGDDAWGGTGAAGLHFDLAGDRMAGPDPVSLAVAFEGQLLESQEATWRLQAKLAVPLLEGISLPLSVTWSNRTETLDESGVVGRVGLAVDTARLLQALAPG